MHPMPPLPPRRWIAHTLAGWMLGVPLLLGLSILFEAVGIDHANAPVGLGMGAAIGLLQARALRTAGVRAQAWWVATLAGVALPFLVADLARRLGHPLPYLVYPFAAVGGLLASLLQLRAWPALRPRAGGWVVASTLGWLLACSSVLGWLALRRRARRPLRAALAEALEVLGLAVATLVANLVLATLLSLGLRALGLAVSLYLADGALAFLALLQALVLYAWLRPTAP